MNRNFTINADKTATFDITTNTLTVSGASTATNGALTKTGANLYTGATTINAGILKVENAGTTTFGKITGSNVTSSIAVSTGGTLLLSGAGDHLGNSAAMTLGGGTDQLFFGNGSGTGLTTSQLTQVKFYSDAGTTILPFAPGFSGFTGGFGEIVPVPEPSSVATVLGLFGLIGWRERRKARSVARSGRQAAS